MRYWFYERLNINFFIISSFYCGQKAILNSSRLKGSKLVLVQHHSSVGLVSCSGPNFLIFLPLRLSIKALLFFGVQGSLCLLWFLLTSIESKTKKKEEINLIWILPNFQINWLKKKCCKNAYYYEFYVQGYSESDIRS